MKRRGKFSETSERLPIQSLNRRTEIVILRELPSKKKKSAQLPLPVQEDAAADRSDSPPFAPLTAADIASFADRNRSRVPQAEVNASIEKLRFPQGETVVSKAQYQAKVKQLSDAFTINQLRKYAGWHRSSHSRTPVYPLSPPGPAHHLRTMDITPWRVTIDALPRKQLHPTSSLHGAKRDASKLVLINDILRLRWGVQREDDFEIAAKGEIQVVLREQQFSLLLAQGKEALKDIVPSERFYKNSSLQLDASQRKITILGPKAEAESIASRLRDLFTSTAYTSLCLQPFRPLLGKAGTPSDFADIFTPDEMDHVATLTKTDLKYDAEAEKVSIPCPFSPFLFSFFPFFTFYTKSHKIRISSFSKEGQEDALRCLISLLPLPSRTTALSLTSDRNTRHAFVVPHARPSILARKFRNQSLGRLTAPAQKLQQEPKAGQSSSSRSRLAPTDGLFPYIIDQLSAQKFDLQGLEPIPGSYWHHQAKVSPWEATFGHVLRPLRLPGQVEITKPKTNHPNGKLAFSPGNDGHHGGAFAPCLPAQLGLFANLGQLERGPTDALPDQQDQHQPLRKPLVHLVARLIPSPLEDVGVLACTAFPEIELSFQEEKLFPRPGKTGVEGGLKFLGMQAVLEHAIRNVVLPNQPLDVCLSRRAVLETKHAEHDKQVGAFVKDIMDSEQAKGSAIRAPATLTVKIPRGIVKCPDEESARSEEERAAIRKLWELVKTAPEEMQVNYMFAGFEYTERRNINLVAERLRHVQFSPNHYLRVDQLEGGFTRGKRTQGSVVAKMGAEWARSGEEAPPSPATVLPMPAIFRSSAGSSSSTLGANEESSRELNEQLVQSALSIVEVVERVQRRESDAVPEGSDQLRKRPVVRKERRPTTMNRHERRRASYEARAKLAEDEASSSVELSKDEKETADAL